jgi:hypothetical protein
MTTPDTVPSLAALYTERAKLAYRIEHGRLSADELWHIQNAYVTVQKKIATQAAQWPARGVRPVVSHETACGETQAPLCTIGESQEETSC